MGQLRRPDDDSSLYEFFSENTFMWFCDDIQPGKYIMGADFAEDPVCAVYIDSRKKTFVFLTAKAVRSRPRGTTQLFRVLSPGLRGLLHKHVIEALQAFIMEWLMPPHTVHKTGYIFSAGGNFDPFEERYLALWANAVLERRCLTMQVHLKQLLADIQAILQECKA